MCVTFIRKRVSIRPIAFALLFILPWPSNGNSAFAANDSPELKALFYPRGGGAAQSRSLNIGRLELEVEIVGGMAQTVAVARFENPSEEPLEGDFTLDLPSGSVVTGYALDVEDKMIEGVLVSHRKGKAVYEASVRRAVDPGIAEVNRNNAFQTHVFPILAGKGRTIRLAFVTPLVAGVPFALPLKTTEPVGAISIHVKVPSQPNPPSLKGPGEIDLRWAATPTGLEARGTMTARPLDGSLEIGTTGPAEPMLLTRHRNGDMFFEINDRVPTANSTTPRPKRVRVYWDSSRSRRDDDLGTEGDLLQRYLGAVRPQVVDLVLFSDSGPQVRTFRGPAAAAGVSDSLAALNYRGATSVESVLSARLPDADICLFFSDGNITVDRYRAEQLPCVLFAISSATGANRAFLSTLAQRSAGAYLDLHTMAAPEALAQLTRASPRIANIADSNGKSLDYTVLPSDTSHFHAVGRVPASGNIVVRLANGTNRIRTYATDRSRTSAYDAAGALWAFHHADELIGSDGTDQDAVLTLARHYSVTVPGTLFIVLESAADYFDAGIEPPPELGGEELAQYRAQKMAVDAEKAAADRRQKLEQARRLDEVISEWTAQRAWWQKKFPIAPVKAEAAPAPAPNSRPDAARPSPSGNTPEQPQQVLITGSLIEGTPGGEADISISVAPWNPDRPYLNALGAASPAAFAAVYREQEREYGSLPAFYLDVAEFLFRRGQAKDAIEVALSVLDLPVVETTTLTILADRMMRYGDNRRALWLYEKILALESDRPQPFRNLALFLIQRAERSTDPAARRKDYVRALGLLNDIVVKTWDPAFDGIELIALMEANRIVPKLRSLGVTKIPLDPRLIALIDVDLRVVLEWNTDLTDMDLWVDEPGGERAFYGHQETSIGGRMSHDMRGGYGPEEYLLRHAPSGTYTIRADTYAADQLNPNGAITVRAHLYRAYSRPNEEEQILELELKRAGEGDSNLVVGTFKVGGGK
jgi:hypothetical protein